MRQMNGDPDGSAKLSMLQGADFELTVLVPTRNESDNIGPLLERLSGALTGRSFEVLFVDDSTDGTPQVIRQQAAASPFPVSVIARPPERRNGLSGAVVEGMESARGRWLCVIDADLQHPPEFIPRLLSQATRTGADLVVASRQADVLGPIGLSRGRALTSQLLTILARMVFPRVLKNVSDPLTGFFLVRREAIDTATLQPEGFKILLEILVRHPDLRVTELHFEFAPRHGGQSKADLNEGVKFFRHLSRLRLTVNQHLIRFIVVTISALALNLLVLVATRGLGLPVMQAALLAGVITVAAVLLGEMWIFNDRPRAPARQRLAGVLIAGSVFLLLVYLPTIRLLSLRLGVPILIAGLAAMVVAGFVYYIFSEQWIWTRGLMMRPRASVYYNIHDILAVASQIPLADLDFFRVPNQPERVDLQIRVDRHGTPSKVPGAICYDEHLGRFGFGLTVMPGEFTEVVVSPLLESSTSFLYTNIVEPVLQWMFVTRGYSLARAGAAYPIPESASGLPRALLVAGQQNLSYGFSRLCQTENWAFMGDDRILVGYDRRAHSFPKPVTITRDMLPDSARSVGASIALRMQRLLYSRPVRRLGLFLSERSLPAATVNTYLQRLIPQPKYPLASLLDGIIYGDMAAPYSMVWLDKGVETLSVMPVERAIDYLLEPGDRAFGFQPYPLIVEELSRWGGKDWNEEERAILRAGLAGCRPLRWVHTGENWWEGITRIAQEKAGIDTSPAPSLSIKSV